MPDAFARPLDEIEQSLVMACSRRALAVANRDRTLATIEAADVELLRFERHVDMCDRQIDGLLDERLRSVATGQQQPAGQAAG